MIGNVPSSPVRFVWYNELSAFAKRFFRRHHFKNTNLDSVVLRVYNGTLKIMVGYRLRRIGEVIAVILSSVVILALLFALFLSRLIIGLVEQAGNPVLTLGISIAAIATPILVIMEGAGYLFRYLNERRIRAELIKVIDAMSSSPEGMDLDAIKHKSSLPKTILLERVNELILLGRVGVKLTANQNREYYLESR